MNATVRVEYRYSDGAKKLARGGLPHAYRTGQSDDVHFFSFLLPFSRCSRRIAAERRTNPKSGLSGLRSMQFAEIDPCPIIPLARADNEFR
jgi:hypothetical protein